MKSISLKKKMRYIAMAIALATGAGYYSVTAYAAPAETTTAEKVEATSEDAASVNVNTTADKDKKVEVAEEAGQKVDSKAEQSKAETATDNNKENDQKEAVEETARSKWIASRPTDEAIEKWAKQYEGKTIVSADVYGVSDDIINAAKVAVRSKPGDMFSVALLERDMNRLYDTGYFYDLYPIFTEVPEGVKVTYKLLETPIITSIEIVGNSEVMPIDKLMDVLTLKPGNRLNRRTLHENIINLQQCYVDNDYVMAKVNDLDVQEDGKLVLRITEGVLEGIKVKGNKKTKDYVIIREIRNKVGEPINRKQLQRSYQRINNLGFFETVDMRPTPGMEPNAWVLEIEVKEKNTGTFGIGAGYSSNDGLLASASLGDSNFRGTGDSANISVEVSGSDTDSKGVTFGYTHPWVDDKETSLSLKVYARKYRYNDYNTDGNLIEEYMRVRKGFEFTFGRPETEYTTNYFTFRNRDDKYSRHRSGGTDRSGALYDPWREKNFGLTRSITFAHATDTRDNYMYPTSGRRTNWSIEYAGLGGDFTFQKYGIEESRFFKVGRNQVLAIRGEYAYSPQNLPESAEYRIGGQSTVRGYRDDQFRGNAMFLGNVEYRFPISQIIKGAIFTDFGSAWESGFKPSKPNGSYGFGISLDTPIGPLRLDLAHGSQGNRVHFNVGNTF